MGASTEEPTDHWKCSVCGLRTYLGNVEEGHRCYAAGRGEGDGNADGLGQEDGNGHFEGGSDVPLTKDGIYCRGSCEIALASLYMLLEDC